MRARANAVFPFAIAVLLPPAGLLVGLAALAQGERDTAVALAVVAVLAGAVWTWLLLGA